MQPSKILVKFTNKKYADSILDGNLFLGSPNIYEQYSNTNQINGTDVGNPVETKSDSFRIYDNSIYSAIYCMSEFTIKDNKLLIEDVSKLSKGLHESAILINKQKFIENFEKSTEKLDLKLTHNPVEYLYNSKEGWYYADERTNNIINKARNPNSKIETQIYPIKPETSINKAIFCQDISHEYQKEYRFWIKNKFILEDNYSSRNFQIDNIREYSIVIPTSKLNEPIQEDIIKKIL